MASPWSLRAVLGERRTARPTVVIAIVAAALSLAACSGSSGLSTPAADPTPITLPGQSADASPADGQGLILLISPVGGGAAMEANVAGVLGVSPEGCLTVGDTVLVAPPGSRVIEGGVHLEGIGDLALGQRVAASGGSVEIGRMPVALRPTGYEQCGAGEVAVISAP